MYQAPQKHETRPAPRPLHRHPSAAVSHLVVAPAARRPAARRRRSSRGFVAAFLGRACTAISRPGPRSPSSRASGRPALLLMHAAARGLVFCASVASSCWPVLAVLLLPGGCAAGRPWLQALSRVSACSEGRMWLLQALARTEPALLALLSRSSSGLAACKTLASKQGSFFLSRAVRVAISSHRMAVEPSQQHPAASSRRGGPAIGLHYAPVAASALARVAAVLHQAQQKAVAARATAAAAGLARKLS